VIKSVLDHPRVENERDVLQRFQHRTPYLRPLIDEIDEPTFPVTIALKYLQGDLLEASVARTLNRREVRHVSRCVLEALKTLHEDGFVHTGTLLPELNDKFCVTDRWYRCQAKQRIRQSTRRRYSIFRRPTRRLRWMLPGRLAVGYIRHRSRNTYVDKPRDSYGITLEHRS
jgi:hypothetical protein